MTDLTIHDCRRYLLRKRADAEDIIVRLGGMGIDAVALKRERDLLDLTLTIITPHCEDPCPAPPAPTPPSSAPA